MVILWSYFVENNEHKTCLNTKTIFDWQDIIRYTFFKILLSIEYVYLNILFYERLYQIWVWQYFYLKCFKYECFLKSIL